MSNSSQGYMVGTGLLEKWVRCFGKFTSGPNIDLSSIIGMARRMGDLKNEDIDVKVWDSPGGDHNLLHAIIQKKPDDVCHVGGDDHAWPGPNLLRNYLFKTKIQFCLPNHLMQ